MAGTIAWKQGYALLRRIPRGVRRLAERTYLRRENPAYVPDGHIDVLVNFPDKLINLYQIRQWYGPLELLSQQYSVAILCYNPVTAEAIRQETSLRVLLTPTFSDISSVADTLRPDVVLYPNQNYQNYRILGYNDGLHAFICHGESDKIYMASNWMKGFDYFLVAGEASRQRLSNHLLNYDVEDRTLEIGRPQIDVPTDPFIDKDPNKITVLYAPTWEGGRESMSYGSVLSHGRLIIEALLADARFRIIYRPHPRTGIRSQAEDAANEAIKQRLQSVVTADPAAGHMVDTTPFGWQLDIADVMITDISAVAYDWLTTAKPLIMTRPVESSVPVAADGLVGALDLLDVTQASDIVSVIDEQLTDEARRSERQELADHYYGDRTPGKSMERFVTAITSMVDEARSWKSTHKPQDRASFAPVTGPRTTADNFVTRIRQQLHRDPQSEAGVEATTAVLIQRHAKVVFSVMGTLDEAGYAFGWLPTLELLNSNTSVAIVCGDYHVYRAMRRATGLRVYYIADTVKAEQVMDSLRPLLTLHATQVRMTLRETTYRYTLHAFLGEPDSDLWINNRLRDFDAIIANDKRQQGKILTNLRPLSNRTHLYCLDESPDVGDQLISIAKELTELARGERRDRDERRHTAGLPPM